MSRIDSLYKDYSSAYKTLTDAGEISASVFLADEFRKLLLIACASEFERVVCDVLLNATKMHSNDRAWLIKLVECRVTARNYHSLFDWNQRNANQFLGMLGDDILSRGKELVKTNQDFKTGMESFMEIGRDRNRLVHGNYLTFVLEKTPEELIATFNSGMIFVEKLKGLILV